MIQMFELMIIHGYILGDKLIMNYRSKHGTCTYNIYIM